MAATSPSNITVHPVIQILQESFEKWETLKQPTNNQASTRNPKAKTPRNPFYNPERLEPIVLRHKSNSYEDFPSYDSNSNYSVGEKRICKRYFINDLPKKKPTKRKSIYYINLDSKGAKSILKVLPELNNKNKVVQELKNPNFLSLLNKRSPNIKVLTIDLLPKGENPMRTSKNYPTEEIKQNSLLSSKMGKGEFLILIQQPKSQANINNLLEEIVSSGAKKDFEESGVTSALNNVSTPQPMKSYNFPDVPAAVGQVLKLFIKSESYYKDLSNRLNDFYAKIVDAKSQ
ncbi:uncharacterized protein [Halyomorpha halys]|nr:uncharacterized protein LOC106683803 isoform X2 [Halyomorpha halys]